MEEVEREGGDTVLVVFKRRQTTDTGEQTPQEEKWAEIKPVRSLVHNFF